MPRVVIVLATGPEVQMDVGTMGICVGEAARGAGCVASAAVMAGAPRGGVGAGGVEGGDTEGVSRGGRGCDREQIDTTTVRFSRVIV